MEELTEMDPATLVEAAITAIGRQVAEIDAEVASLVDRQRRLQLQIDALRTAMEHPVDTAGATNPPVSLHPTPPADTNVAPATPKRASKRVEAAKRLRNVEPSPARKGSRPPLSEIADVVNAAPSTASPVQVLADHYKLPITTVKNWLAAARKDGLLAAPATPTVRVLEDNTLPDAPVKMPDLQVIADHYKKAVSENRRPIGSIVDEWGCTREQAQAWVGIVRAAGLLPPRDEPQVPADLPPARAVPQHMAGAML